MTVAQQKKRSLRELRERAKPAIKEKKLVMIAQYSTPSAAYDLTILNNANEELAQACRWLAMIRRDYGAEAFKEATQAE
ncbi:MAG: hypothetical protein Greene071421_140 [Parcubacteria group bacterium Greene0714_21]|nr:MAG: hypothetical protein Greene041639_212 [Parcubacteria group bacterium Greene0416_39]TSC98543.1 MAG: hypothetical protein Greene101447_45 [Parcubacteria group bacterium Greene1014_47]TSD04304.1 MAG: hypothetical protein Greene071421_140 [Parcubacteria group bacterium Greene0714_21]